LKLPACTTYLKPVPSAAPNPGGTAKGGKRWIALVPAGLACVLLFMLGPVPALPARKAGSPPQYDRYGGLTAAKVPGCEGKYFHLGMLNGRAILVTPECNAFPLRMVFNFRYSFIEPQVMQARYGGDGIKWAHRGLLRLQDAGFKGLAEYSYLRALPVGTYGSKTGNSPQVPFLLLLNASSDALYHPTSFGYHEPVDDIMAGVERGVYPGWRRPVLDPYSPIWPAAVAYEIKNLRSQFTGGDFNNIPWIVGITTEDADHTWLLKSKDRGHPNVGWIVAVSAPQQVGRRDPKVYAKYAWVSYLQQKYGSIEKLNAAWGSNYSSWEGPLDETGDGRWLGRDAYFLTDTAPAVKQDLLAFTRLYVLQVFQTEVKAIRACDTNHLIFSVSAFHGDAWPEVLLALKEAGVNVLELAYDANDPAKSTRDATAAYDLTGLPVDFWYGVTAGSDSYWHACRVGYRAPDFPPQSNRGRHYFSDVKRMYGMQGADGVKFVVGFGFWGATDDVGKILRDARGNFLHCTGEATNWGLMSNRDNSYDGKCAVRAPSTDQWGYPCGGEDRDYGDFLSSVKQANAWVDEQYLVSPAPEPVRKP
jgi:hypothetical protein